MKDSCLNAKYMKNLHTHRCTATLLYPMSTLWTDLVLFELLSLGRIEAEDVRRLSYQNLPIRHTLTGRDLMKPCSPCVRGRWAIPAFPIRGQFPLLFHFALTWVLLWTLHQLVWSHLSSYKPLCAFPGFWLGMRLTSGTDFPVLAACCKGGLCQLFSPQASSFDSLGDMT